MYARPNVCTFQSIIHLEGKTSLFAIISVSFTVILSPDLIKTTSVLSESRYMQMRFLEIFDAEIID